MSGDFLSRWSRRKREAQARAPEGEPPEREAPAREPPAASPEPAPSEPELTPEEIAALPKPEELTPESDLAVFFRKGVPEMLRNAALRRMWSLDPAIRDHVGDARDYAYDWNLPGGVPGNGPLLPTDDVDAMVREVFGERGGAESDAPQRADAAPGVEASSRVRDAAPPQDDAEAAPDAAGDPPAAGDRPPEAAVAVRGETPKREALWDLPAAARDAAEPAPAPPAAASGRRHGRARPI